MQIPVFLPGGFRPVPWQLSKRVDFRWPEELKPEVVPQYLGRECLLIEQVLFVVFGICTLAIAWGAEARGLTTLLWT
jgi:hypothetical protein